jgi:hypothetical protein
MLLPAPYDIFIERGITYGPLVITVYDDLPPLTTPDAPTVTAIGSAGVATWTYNIVARNPDTGQFSAVSADGSVTRSSVLSTTDYNTIRWTKVSGAKVYDVYRMGTGTTPSTTGLLRSTTSVNFNDVGLDADGSTPPVTGGPGVIIDLTGFTAHAQARRIPDDTILQDLTPAVTDPTGGVVEIPKFRDEETLDFTLCTNGKWSLVLENSTGDWLPPIIAGAYTVVNSVTRDAA